MGHKRRWGRARTGVRLPLSADMTRLRTAASSKSERSAISTRQADWRIGRKARRCSRLSLQALVADLGVAMRHACPVDSPKSNLRPTDMTGKSLPIFVNRVKSAISENQNFSLPFSPKWAVQLRPFQPAKRGVSRASRTLGWNAVDAAASGALSSRRAG